MPSLTLTEYRADLDNILATAVDSSTWTTTIKDEALRQTLVQFAENGPVYEASFTVTSTAYTVDLSTITSIHEILAIAYPWSDGEYFEDYITPYRLTDDLIIRSDEQFQSGEVIRVRYHKLHLITSLDSAASTTVPDHHRRTIGLGAAAWCCEQRLRQISENPAIPRDAQPALIRAQDMFRTEFWSRLQRTQPRQNPSWPKIGL